MFSPLGLANGANVTAKCLSAVILLLSYQWLSPDENCLSRWPCQGIYENLHKVLQRSFGQSKQELL